MYILFVYLLVAVAVTAVSSLSFRDLVGPYGPLKIGKVWWYQNGSAKCSQKYNTNIESKRPSADMKFQRP